MIKSAVEYVPEMTLKIECTTKDAANSTTVS